MATLDPFRIPLATSLIEASAGTGKTYTITTLVLRLLLERDLSIGEILVVTFTKAATAELRDRIRQRLRQAIAAFETTDPVDPVLTTLRTQFPDHAQARPRLQAALRDFDRAAIFTIHGFCQRALPRAGMAEDEGEIIEDASAQLQELVSDYWTAHLAAAPPLFVDYVLFKKRQTLRDLLLLARHSAADPSLLVLPVPCQKPLTKMCCLLTGTVGRKPPSYGRINDRTFWLCCKRLG